MKNIFQRYEKREVFSAYGFLLPILLIIITFILIPVIGTTVSSFMKEEKGVPKIISVKEFEEDILASVDDDIDKEFILKFYIKEDNTYILSDKINKDEKQQMDFLLNMYGYEGRFIFNGVGNYSEIFSKDDFWHSFLFTLIFALTTVVFEIVLGMIFALLLNETFPGRGLLRAVVLIPWAIPTIISARTWELIYNFNYGILNHIIKALGFSPDGVNWFGTGFSAFWALVIADVWKTTPFVVIILLAGLQAIPTDIYKQARIDGTGMLKTFWKITLPLIRPILTIALIFRTIDSLRIFDLVFVLTSGGPGGATETLSTLGQKYFIQYNNFEMGSAISVITFIVAFSISILYIKTGKFSESIK